MSTPDFVPHVAAASVGITIFEASADPVIVLTYQLEDGTMIHLGLTADELESTFPTTMGAVVRARVLTEMITLYPEQRDEIIQNILFRWTDGGIGEVENGS